MIEMLCHERVINAITRIHEPGSLSSKTVFKDWNILVSEYRHMYNRVCANTRMLITEELDEQFGEN